MSSYNRCNLLRSDRIADLLRDNSELIDTLVCSAISRKLRSRSEEHTSELQSQSNLHSFPTRRSSDLLSMQRRIKGQGRPACISETYLISYLTHFKCRHTIVVISCVAIE